MRRFASVVVLLLTCLLAAADNGIIVRSVNVSGTNTYTIEGSGFSPKEGATPVVTINGLTLVVKTFTNTSIVGTLAAPVTGDYTVKIVNSKGLSTTYTVAENPEKLDLRPAQTEGEGVNVAAFYMHLDSAFETVLPPAQPEPEANLRDCNPTAPPGIPLPPLGPHCH